MKARCMLLDCNLPMQFWAEAIYTACYLHQHMPNLSLRNYISSYDSLTRTKAKVHYLMHFGYTAYKWIPKAQQSVKNFGPCSKPCIFLGYVYGTTKVWHLWDFEQNKAIECSNV
jgi:hypothetical protein